MQNCYCDGFDFESVDVIIDHNLHTNGCQGLERLMVNDEDYLGNSTAITYKIKEGYSESEVEVLIIQSLEEAFKKSDEFGRR